MLLKKTPDFVTNCFIMLCNMMSVQMKILLNKKTKYNFLVKCVHVFKPTVLLQENYNKILFS